MPSGQLFRRSLAEFPVEFGHTEQILSGLVGKDLRWQWPDTTIIVGDVAMFRLSIFP